MLLWYIRYLTNVFWVKISGHEFKHTVPTWLSLSRLFAAPMIVGIEFFGTHVSYTRWVLISTFICACLTDFFDGRLARWIPAWESEFGQYIDQFADKVFVISIIIWVFATGRIGYDGYGEIEFVLVPIIIFRDVTLMIARTFIILPANKPAKWKTAFQMIALGFIVGRGLFGDFFGLPINESGTFFLWLATGFSVWSFAIYAEEATPVLLPKLKAEIKNLLPIIKVGVMKWFPTNLF